MVKGTVCKSKPQHLNRPQMKFEGANRHPAGIMFLQVLAAAANGSLEFQDIFMFSHQQHNVHSIFVEIETASGATIILSPNHYLWVQSASTGPAKYSEEQGKLIQAKDVHEGDSVPLASVMDNMLAMTEVIEVTRKVHQGLFNPHTASGSIVVNGVLASTFTSTIPPSIWVHSLITFPAWAIYQVAKLFNATGLAAASKINAVMLHAYFQWDALLLSPLSRSLTGL